jgi:ABC-2 type transport system ATP-binding protein
MQVELNAAGKKASTTGRPRKALSVTGWRSWSISVKSGAAAPTSTVIKPPGSAPRGLAYTFFHGSVSIFGLRPVVGAQLNAIPEEPSVIEVQHLTKRYGRFTAVEDLSFRVERGEILGFLGPNGAGKTTTMRILTGYMPATEGKASVAGFDVFDQPIEAKRRTGYLPETPPLYPDMSVAEYLDFVARIKGVAPGERRDRIRRTMERTRIADMANRLCANLSKGYRQRVGLAQALIHNPDVLILDEPTAGLDPKQIIETRELIKELAGTHTIVLSTHILPEVSQTCQRVVIINRGKVVAVDTPDNLTRRLRGSETLYVQIDAGNDDARGILRHVDGVTRVSESDRRENIVGFEVESEHGHDIRRDLARAVIANNWGLLELRPMRMSLEEIFLSLTTEEQPAAPVEGETANA